MRPAGSDQQNYQAAFDLIQARKYEDANRAFREFLVAFPQSPLADNAQYWLAETHYVRRQFKDALPEFVKVTTQYRAVGEDAGRAAEDRLLPGASSATRRRRARRCSK